MDIAVAHSAVEDFDKDVPLSDLATVELKGSEGSFLVESGVGFGW
jgi:hypothetical protein